MKQFNKIALIAGGQVLIIMVALFIFVQLFDVRLKNQPDENTDELRKIEKELALDEAVLPSDGVVLPIDLKDFGKQMIDKGVIDKEKFEALYEKRGGLDEDSKEILYGVDNKNPVINFDNSGFLLNFLWAFGLANSNPILDNGPMQDEQYGGAGNFASTGGWSLSTGDAMDYYSQYSFVRLSPAQQAIVEEVSRNIYRPCCGNSTYFPDCNHGMAMLGLLEIMASQDISKEEMYDVALAVNSYWFEDTYLTIAKYFEGEGVNWSDVNAKEVLSSFYSSAFGYRDILSKVAPPDPRNSGGGSCGV